MKTTKKIKFDHETIVALQHLVVDKVSAIRISDHGGMIAILLKDGTKLKLACRLYSEAKEKLKAFSSKYKVSQKVAFELGLFK